MHLLHLVRVNESSGFRVGPIASSKRENSFSKTAPASSPTLCSNLLSEHTQRTRYSSSPPISSITRRLRKLPARAVRDGLEALHELPSSLPPRIRRRAAWRGTPSPYGVPVEAQSARIRLRREVWLRGHVRSPSTRDARTRFTMNSLTSDSSQADARSVTLMGRSFPFAASS